MNQLFSPIFGPDEECWQCRQTHPKFLPCLLSTDDCKLCGVPLFTTWRYQTSEGIGPLCEGCYNSYHLSSTAWESAPFRMAVWTEDAGSQMVESLEEWKRLLAPADEVATVSPNKPNC